MPEAAPPVSQLPLLNLTNGFIGFKTFAAAVEMDVFTRLADGRTVDVGEFAAELGIEHRPAVVLLTALVSLELLEKDGDRYRNSSVAETFLVEGKPYFFGCFLQYYNHAIYPVCQQLVGALQANRPVFTPTVAAGDEISPEYQALFGYFWEAMHSLAGFTASLLSERYDFARHRRVLDVGGGSAGFPIELCQRVPTLAATVYDLPQVCDIAARKVAEAGLAQSIDTIAGDFTSEEPLPDGYDVILLSQIFHTAGEQENRALLEKCWRALPPGGSVIVCDLLLNPDRTGPSTAALMGMSMMLVHDGGQNYSETEYLTWLSDQGFVDLDILRFDAAGANGAVVGRKPVAA
jgi:SAM-dependent methyltransferase